MFAMLWKSKKKNVKPKKRKILDVAFLSVLSSRKLQQIQLTMIKGSVHVMRILELIYWPTLMHGFIISRRVHNAVFGLQEALDPGSLPLLYLWLGDVKMKGFWGHNFL